MLLMIIMLLVMLPALGSTGLLDIGNENAISSIRAKDDDDWFNKQNSDWINLPDHYKSLSAASKSALLMSKIVNSEYGKSERYSERSVWPRNFIRQLTEFANITTMSRAFTCNEQNPEVFPLDRPRFQHKLGVVGAIDFSIIVPKLVAYNYTGLLAAGTTSIGLVRLSHSMDPKSINSHSPGMGIKLFIDGQSSADVVMSFDMDSVLTNNTDFFHTVLRTTFPCPMRQDLKFVADFFTKVEDPFNTFPLRQLARFTQTGIPVENPSYPVMLNFVPHERLIGVIPKNSRKDFRDELMQRVTPGPLYDVYAATDVQDTSPVKIGLVTLTSRLIQSDFGDTRLCFRHRRNKAEKHLENDF